MVPGRSCTSVYWERTEIRIPDAGGADRVTGSFGRHPGALAHAGRAKVRALLDEHPIDASW